MNVRDVKRTTAASAHMARSVGRLLALAFVAPVSLAACSAQPPVEARTLGSGASGATSDTSTDGWGGAGASQNGCGEHQWSQRFGDDHDEEREDSGYRIATDPAGRVTLLGTIGRQVDEGGGWSRNDPAIFVTSFEPDGDLRWSRTTVQDSISRWAYPYQVAHDGTGNTFITGYFTGTIDFGDGPLLSTPVPVLGEDGYLLPEFEDCCYFEYAGFLVKYGPAGELLWSKRFGQTEVLCEDYCKLSHDYPEVSMTLPFLSVSAAGEILLSGGFLGEVDFGGGPLACAGTPDNANGFDNADDGFIAKLDGDGNHLWSVRAGDVGGDGLWATFDEDGEVNVNGLFEGSIDLGGGPLHSAGGPDVLLARLDANGQHLWSTRLGTTSDDELWAQFVPGGGGIMLSGTITDPPLDLGAGPMGTPGERLLAKLDPGGALLWSRTITDTAPWGVLSDVGLGGEILLGGTFDHTMDFGDATLEDRGVPEFFLAKFAADGSMGWVKRFGGALVTAPEVPHCPGTACHRFLDVRLDGDGSALITGYFRGVVDFGGGPLESQGMGDGFLAKFGP